MHGQLEMVPLFSAYIARANLGLSVSAREQAVERALKLCLLPGDGRQLASNIAHDFHFDPAAMPLLPLIAGQVDELAYSVLGYTRSITRFYIGRCWPNVRFREAGKMHFHAGAIFSGVLYLQVPIGAGGLEFLKPFRTAADSIFRQANNSYTASIASMSVSSGDLVLFNSEFSHRAAAGSAESDQPRVLIAFDIFATTDVENVTGGTPHSDKMMSLDGLRSTVGTG